MIQPVKSFSDVGVYRVHLMSVFNNIYCFVCKFQQVIVNVDRAFIKPCSCNEMQLLNGPCPFEVSMFRKACSIIPCEKVKLPTSTHFSIFGNGSESIS